MSRWNWAFPVGLLGLTLAAYAPLIYWLGYYWDDWPVIYLIKNRADLWSFYAYDRPFSAWTYLISGPLLGLKPLGWHLFSLLLRWLTTLGLWLALRQIWPLHRREVAWAALLFAVNPAFTLQPIAVAFSQHLITFSLFVFSTGAMLAAQRNPQRFYFFSILAITSQLVHMLTMEYLWGLELLRPILLWLAAAPLGRVDRWKRVMIGWFPYLLLFALLAIWRVGFLELPGGDPNELILVERILSEPLTGLQRGLNMVLWDVLHLLVTTWTDMLSAQAIDVADRFLVASWLWAGAIGSVAFWFLGAGGRQAVAPVPRGPFYRQAIPLGMVAMLLALIPTWATDNQITVGLYSSRFALPALLGSSLLLAGLIDFFIRSTRLKVAAVALLLGLAVGAHLRGANDFRWDWVKQQRFFWQLSWRVPGVEPGTAFFSDGAMFRYVGGYPTAAALNSFYPATYPQQTYWFFELDRNFRHDMDGFVAGQPIRDELRNLVYRGSSRNGIALFYQPESGRCLWVLGPEQAGIPVLPELTAQAAEVSALDRIETALPGPDISSIFGPEPERSWCYYYQKADLARQMLDWDQVLRLYAQADRAGFQPASPYEYFPFIEAFMASGDRSQAEALMVAAYRISKKGRDRPVLCAHWAQIADPDGSTVANKMDCDLLP